MEHPEIVTAFVEAGRVAEGPVAEVLAVLWQRHRLDPSETQLVFELETGRQLDYDLSGSLEDTLARLSHERARGPGRPRLGVVSREVSLLPRHWEWLEHQPQGLSATLRRLVDQARKAAPGEERARKIRSALNNVLTALGGNLPGYEEATRALFAGHTALFEHCVAGWPTDLHDYVVARARAAEIALNEVLQE